MRIHMSVIIVAATAFAIAFPVHVASGRAAVRTWHVGGFGSPVSGAFNNPNRWRDENNQTGVPGSIDTAVVNYPSTFFIDFEDISQASDRLLMRRGFVTFHLPVPGGKGGYELLNPMNLTPSIVVGMFEGDIAALTLQGDGGAAPATMHGRFMDLGLEPGAFGMVTLRQNADLHNDWQLRVGNQGGGLFTIEHGTATNHVATVGNGSAAFGMATVTGPLSLWQCAGSLHVGKGGYGELHVLDGGAVASLSSILAQQNTGFAVATVAGAGSEWDVDGTLDIGMKGPATLTISGGAVVTNHTYATLSTYHPTDVPSGEVLGRVFIRDVGSMWNVNGNLWVGLASTASGELTFAQGGRVNVVGDLLRSLFGNHRIYLEVGTSAEYAKEPAIAVGGTSAAFTVEVSLLHGFVPEIGDSFHVASAADFMDAWSFILPPLPPDREWSVLQLATDIELHVVAPGPNADLNGDGVVDVLDLLILLDAWGACKDCGECPADLNGDCSVDVLDLLILLDDWG